MTRRRALPPRPAGLSSRTFRTQRQHRLLVKQKQPEQTQPEQKRSRNWAAIASVIAALAAAAGVFYTGLSLEATRAQNFTDRFTNAVDQLDRSGPDHLQARLGAIYALELLARDSPRDHPTVMEVLAAFIRTTAPSRPRFGVTDDPCPRGVTAPDVQAALTALGRRDVTHDSETGLINLGGACLRGAVLGGANLAKMYLKYADLSLVNLTGADLRGTYLEGAELVASNLSKADLTHADLSNSVAVLATFDKANLTEASLRRADLHEASFVGANALRVNFGHARLDNAVLRGADLRGARLSNANLRSADLAEARHDSSTVTTGAMADMKTVGKWW